MRVVEIFTVAEGLSLRQRWAHVFTMVLALVMLLLGLNFRSGVINATAYYESPRAGISAYYPLNWLIDTSDDYVFRVRDMSRSGFKTTFQVAVRPVGSNASERNVADRLTLERLPIFTDYSVLAEEEFILPDGEVVQGVTYSFVQSDASPFLQGLPSVVRGLDILAIRGEQAIVITYRADADIYEAEYPRFEEFLRRLQF